MYATNNSEVLKLLRFHGMCAKCAEIKRTKFTNESKLVLWLKEKYAANSMFN